ncbi:helix-turn-helix transcriptional regulator [Celeribacter sp.]|uniref:helix-turn-helix transcriptional regulator n=1 Tax=Celeribacter sp. TaxID=1890673 RepID=UPI003A92D4EE
MSKSDRLFRLLHLIRGLTPPVTAARLAGAMEVSERTIYRDIDALRAAGARIEGETGVGYTMTEDPALPPQTFSQLEIEALVLGLSEVQSRGDAALSEAAANALTKITATLNERQQRQAAHAVNLVHRFYEPEVPQVDMTVLREATWTETALDISYCDAEGRRSERHIYPLAIVYLDHRVMILAWCCLRQDFRKFIADRIVEARRTDESFRPRRVPLLRDYITALGTHRQRPVGT